MNQPVGVDFSLGAQRREGGRGGGGEDASASALDLAPTVVCPADPDVAGWVGPDNRKCVVTT